ncbi:MAG: CDP-glucose 4,6-dehydratase, partial [Magnetococcales bacterium]|nr:CDP-glucose 4,6-dehydratase [Magnetococcales bacterium]
MSKIAQWYRNRRVLITGHTGFKGSWLTLWLHHWGARVSGLALPPATQPSLFHVLKLPTRMAGHQEGDVGNMAALRHAVETSDAEVIFHLAAQALVRPGYQDPVTTFHTNVMGVVNLLEVVRQRQRPCVVIVVTSDKCYANHEHVWGYRECDPMGGDDPYSASKGAAELVVSAYRHSFFPPGRISGHGVALASVRAGNVVGGGDWAKDRLVPDIVRAVSSGSSVFLRNPKAVRPWQHVLDPLHGYLVLGERLANAQDQATTLCSGWNFAPFNQDTSVTVGEITQRFTELFSAPPWQFDAGHHPHEAHTLRLSIDKALN